MAGQSSLPKAFKREAAKVVPKANVYNQAEVPTGSSFKPLDNLVGAIGKQMNIARPSSYWEDVAKKFSPANGLGGSIDIINTALTTDTDKLLKDLGNQFGSVGFINDLTGGELQRISDYMNVGTIQLAYQNGVAVVDELKDNLSAGGIMDAARKLLGDVAGFELINNSALFGLANFVLDNLESSGLVDLFDNIIDKIEDKKTQLLLLKQRAKSAAGEGDIGLCRHYIDKMGKDEAYSMREDILPLIVSSYEISKDDKRPFVEQATEIVDLMNAIDSNWHLKDGKPYTKYFHTMSSDCICVFSCLNSILAPMAIACNKVHADINATEVSSSALGVVYTEQ